MAYISHKMTLDTAAKKEAITMVFFIPKIDARNWKVLATKLFNEKTGKIEEFFYGIAVGINPKKIHEGFDLSPTDHSYENLFKILEKRKFFPLAPIQDSGFKSSIEAKLTDIVSKAVDRPSNRKSVKSKVKSLATSIKEFAQSYIAGAVHPDTWRRSLSRHTVNQRKWKDENSDRDDLYEEGYETAMYETGQLHDAIVGRVFLIPVKSYVTPIIEARHKGMVNRYKEYHKKHPKASKTIKKAKPKQNELSPALIRKNLLQDKATKKQIEYINDIVGRLENVVVQIKSHEGSDKKRIESLKMTRNALMQSLKSIGYEEFVYRETGETLTDVYI